MTVLLISSSLVLIAAFDPKYIQLRSFRGLKPWFVSVLFTIMLFAHTLIELGTVNVYDGKFR